ncbi:MAG: type II secretion system F family protein [Deltaproteobacteria bacterium]|nr:MAG: type II secretion system F family protein [Deltaproteobacteria bacterium]
MTALYVTQWIAAAAAAAGCALALAALRRARAAAAAGTRDGDIADAPAPRGWLRALAAPVAARLRPTSQAELDELTTLLMHAGRRQRDAVDRYLEERVLALVAGLVAAVPLAMAVGGLWGMLLADVAIVAGVLGPKKALELRAAERRDAIAAALPSAVDLLTTCIQAGLALDQAIARVARDLELSAPILADELRLTASELDAGVSLPDGLRRLSRRVGLDDLSALCGVIAQAHGLGAPIGDTLHEYADSSRKQRMSMLEERAGKIAAQITLPLAICFLPAAMLVILGPAAVQLIRALQ